MHKRKSQASASAAATLIAIIAGLIVLYILFLPPGEREKLLENGGEDNGDTDSEEENSSILLLEAPKQLYPVSRTKFEQEFPSFSVYIGEEAVELKKQDTVYVKKSLLSERRDNVTFEIVDLENTNNLLMSFVVAGGRGRLIMILNGHEIYNAEVASQNIEPIELKEYLQEGVNVVEFAVSSPGVSFWKTNEYSVEDIIITADVKNLEAQESELTFVISQPDRDNLKKLSLRFIPDCTVTEVGRLNIWINNHNLYSAVPDCGSSQKPIEFSPDRLVAGENTLRFSTNRGKYLVDNVKLTSELKKADIPVYYFELNQSQINKVNNRTLLVSLYMKFIDDKTQKTADIYVNNHAIRLDQTEEEFEEDISDDVVKGNNAIKIEPEETLDVVELKVMVEKN